MRTKELQTLHSHTQLVAFIRDDFTFMRSKRHQNYKRILSFIAESTDKSRDWVTKALSLKSSESAL